jgi:hypothetical protein
MNEMNNLTFYDAITGEIQVVYSGQNLEGQKAALAELAWVDGHYDGSKVYILNGESFIRPVQLTEIGKVEMTADGIDVITISGAPDNATFTARNPKTGDSISGSISGTDTFSTVVPGTWKLKIEKFPYMVWEATVNAV